MYLFLLLTLGKVHLAGISESARLLDRTLRQWQGIVEGHSLNPQDHQMTLST